MWLLLYPNTPYMVAGFIHYDKTDFSMSSYAYPNMYAYATSIVIWINTMYVLMGVVLSNIIGILSLKIIYHLIAYKIGKTLSNIAILIISLLSGYAVYIGKFLKLNSWDVLNPISFVSKLINGTNVFAIQFSLLMATYIVATFFIFIIITSEKLGNL